MSPSYHNVQNWTLLLVLTIIWGTSYLLIKKGLVAFSALEVTQLRISISFFCSVPFVFRAIRTISRKKYLTLLLVGIFGSGAPAFLFATSMTHSGSALNGILNSLTPIWTLLIGYFMFRLPVMWLKIFGVMVGFGGALLLVLGKADARFEVDILYGLLPLAATFCYGLSANITKQKLQEEKPLYTTALSMTMIGLPAFVSLMLGNAPAKIATGNVWMPLMGIAFLAIFGTLIAWILFYRLLQRTDALFASSVTYLIPLVAVGWGIFDGEVLTFPQLGGTALILTGVYFTTRSASLANP